MDFPGAGQIEVIGGYAYIGHMDPPHGTSIPDTSDPKNPALVSRSLMPGVSGVITMAGMI